MAQVTITINGRTYRLDCGEGEETHLLALADRIGQEVDDLSARFGQIGDDRLLLMAALGIADELGDVRRQLAKLQARLVDGTRPAPGALDFGDIERAEITDQIEAVANRIEELSAQLARVPEGETPS